LLRAFSFFRFVFYLGDLRLGGDLRLLGDGDRLLGGDLRRAAFFCFQTGLILYKIFTIKSGNDKLKTLPGLPRRGLRRSRSRRSGELPEDEEDELESEVDEEEEDEEDDERPRPRERERPRPILRKIHIFK